MSGGAAVRFRRRPLLHLLQIALDCLRLEQGRTSLLPAPLFADRDVRLRKVHRERAAESRTARQVDLAAKESRDLTANGESQTGSAVLARSGAIGLTERFPNDLLLVFRNSNSRIVYFERDHMTRVVEDIVV